MKATILALTIAAVSGISATIVGYQPEPEGTFSIVARDPNSGELGMAVQSKALATGSRTITIKGGVGVVAHQSQANPMYGTFGLELLTNGMSPQHALDLMLRSDEGRNTRQVAIIDAAGRTAAWTGSEALDWKGHQCGPDFCAQGNILTGPEVVQAIAKAFESSTGLLAERMLSALDAGQAAGGDARGTQAAAIVVAKPLAGPAGFGDRMIEEGAGGDARAGGAGGRARRVEPVVRARAPGLEGADAPLSGLTAAFQAESAVRAPGRGHAGDPGDELWRDVSL